MSLRVFLARTPRGWHVMPGGFARVGRTQDATAIAMQRGGSVADVWVVSRQAGRNVTLLPSPAAPYRRARPGELPSRAADNLFWLGRYVERAEGLMRLLRAYHVRLAETAAPTRRCSRTPAAYLGLFGVDPSRRRAAGPARRASRRRPPAPATCATASRSTAGWR